MSDWIPIKKKLPNIEEKVLIKRICGGREIISYSIMKTEWYGSGFHNIDTGKMIAFLSEITYWKPIKIKQKIKIKIK